MSHWAKKQTSNFRPFASTQHVSTKLTWTENLRVSWSWHDAILAFSSRLWNPKSQLQQLHRFWSHGTSLLLLVITEVQLEIWVRYFPSKLKYISYEHTWCAQRFFGVICAFCAFGRHNLYKNVPALHRNTRRTWNNMCFCKFTSSLSWETHNYCATRSLSYVRKGFFLLFWKTRPRVKLVSRRDVFFLDLVKR